MPDTVHLRPRVLNRVICWSLGAVGAVLAVLVAAFVFWSHSTEHELKELIESYRAMGERVFVEDFVAPDLPDFENAAYFYNRAYQYMQLAPDEQKTLDEFRGELPLTAAEAEFCREALLSRSRVLADMRLARECKHARWNLPVEVVFEAGSIREYHEQRALATFIGQLLLYELRNGHHANAAERMRDMLHHAAMVERMTPSLVAHLMALGVSAMANDRIELLATWEDAPHRVVQPVSAEQIKTLISDLLDESGLIRGWIEALEGERAMQFYHYNRFPEIKWLAAMSRRDMSIALRRVTCVRDAGLEASWSSGVTMLATRPDPSSLFSAPIMKLHQTLDRNVQQPMALHYRVIADRRLIATALAIRLYRREHGGVFPPTLDALVPRYIAAIPVDPFDPGSTPLRYVSDTEPPIVYSVGSNGVDNGGARGWGRPGVYSMRWDWPDAVLPLVRDVPAEDAPP